MIFKRRRNAVVALVLATMGAAAWSQHGETVLIDEPVNGDTYKAAREVRVDAPIGGDLLAAGQVIVVDAAVAGDVMAAGQRIEIHGTVADDVRAAGQDIRVTAPVTGHVVAAGQSVIIDKPVGDFAWLAGKTVEVGGNVGGDLKVAAETVTVTGEVAGDAVLMVDSLTLGPQAVIRGDLHWHGTEPPDLGSDANILGDIVHEPLADFVTTDDRDGSAIWFTATVVVTMVAFYLLFPGPLQRVAGTLRQRPLPSLGLGLAVFATIPLVIVLLLVTGVGALLGMGLGAIYLLLLLAGVLSGLFGISDFAVRRIEADPRRWQTVTAIVVAVVAVALLARIPLLGFLLVVTVWTLGLGALSLRLAHGYRDVRGG